MAQKIQTVLIDDITGDEVFDNGGTVTFGVNGRTYEMDLNETNLRKFNETMDFYVAHARRASGHPQPAAPAKATPDYDTRAVRRWAEAKQIEVPKRGRIPNAVIEQFKAAGN